jgi:cytochrome c biogenesis protein CcdA
MRIKSMPKKMEQALKKEAKKKGLSGKRANAYIYGAMRATGWTPSTQKKAK